MWLISQWKLYRALRRYSRERDMRRLLSENWKDSPALDVFLKDINQQLYGEEQQKLQQKQAEYLALQNQINPIFSTTVWRPSEPMP